MSLQAVPVLPAVLRRVTPARPVSPGDQADPPDMVEAEEVGAKPERRRAAAAALDHMAPSQSDDVPDDPPPRLRS